MEDATLFALEEATETEQQFAMSAFPHGIGAIVEDIDPKNVFVAA